MQTAELCKKWGIGLTGGIACGKTTVARLLSDKGFLVIDADRLAREAVEPGTKGLAKIVELFSGAILNENGTLNRRHLGEIVFSDAEKRSRLEKILHPIIRELMSVKLTERGLFQHPRFWFYEASLLFETGRNQEFRQIWAVTCPLPVQIARLKTRDNRDREMAEKIIASQLPADEKARLADTVIDTSSPLDHLDAKIRHALSQLPGKSGISRIV